MTDCAIDLYNTKMSAKKKSAKAGAQGRKVGARGVQARRAEQGERKRAARVRKVTARVARTREQQTQTEPREAMRRMVEANFQRLNGTVHTRDTMNFITECFDTS